MRPSSLLGGLLALILLLSACVQTPEPPIPTSQRCFEGLEGASVHTLSSQESNIPFVPGQVLVKYRAAEGISPQSLQITATAVQRTYDLNLLEAGGQVGPDLLQVAPDDNVLEVVAALEADPRVEYAQPNYYLYPLETIPNDPLYADEQWNMSNFGLPEAWDLETGHADITIAVIDTGVDIDHEDLAGKILPGCDFAGRDSDANPGGNAHGTHVAGIAAAIGNNNRGIAGVAFTGVKILPVKAFPDAGSEATSKDVADAIRWAAGVVDRNASVHPNAYPADIINISLGAAISDPNLDDAVEDAWQAGAIVVAASGNDFRGDLIFSPAKSPFALAVGSVNYNYRRSDFSNYDTDGRSVDLMAPGGIGPSSCDYIASTLPDDQYGCMAGTSMAAPFVSGVAALVWSQNPGLTNKQVRNILLNSTYFDSTYMNQAEYGQGIICADRALGAETLCGALP